MTTTRLASRTLKHRRHVLAAAAAALVGALAIPGLAQGHIASGTISCTEATIDYTKFSSGPQSVQWQLLLDNAVTQSGTYRFAGPGGILSVPISITDTSEHVLSFQTGWGSTPIHEVAHATLTCATPPPAPQPAPAPAAEAPAPAPVPALAPPAAVPVPPPPTTQTKAAPRAPCPLPDMRLELFGPRAVFAGQVASYRLSLRNAGDNPAINVRVRTVMPPGFSLSAASLGFRMPTLAPGRSAGMTIRAKVGATATGDRTIRARAVEHCSATRAAKPINLLAIAPAAQPAVTG